MRDESVSAFREWLEEQWGLRNEREAFSTAVENCHNAKADLENIPYKKPCEIRLINQAKYILKGYEVDENLSSDELQNYIGHLERVTIKMQAEYDTYNNYKDHMTDYVWRRVFGVTNCCCGPRDK